MAIPPGWFKPAAGTWWALALCGRTISLTPAKRAAQVTYFILPEYTRQGLGTALLAFFVGEARKMGLDSLLANISSRNRQSLEFHLKNGFRECARFLKVGHKFGEDVDAVWMQKQLATGAHRLGPSVV